MDLARALSLAGSAFFTCLLATPATSVPVQYSFTFEVTVADGRVPLAALGFSPGAVGSGTLTYDTDAPGSTDVGTGVHFVFAPPFAGELSFEIGSLTVTSSGSLGGTLLDRPTGDRLEFYASADSDPAVGFGNEVLVEFLDPSGTALTGTQLPGIIDLGTWTGQLVFGGHTFVCNEFDECSDVLWSAYASIESLTLVPEPSTLCLVASGLAALAGRGRRARPPLRGR
jgi:hypothetical protein